MQDFSYILSLTSPTFMLIAMGYLVVKMGWMPKENVRPLAWFVVNIGLPAALFKALSSRSFQDILHYDYLLVYGLGSLFSFATLFILARLRNKTITECALFGLGASVSNSLMVGFPIVTQLFGDEALVPFTLTLIVENLFILPLALALADTGQQKNNHFITAFAKSLPQLIKNPIILSIALGLASTAFDIQPPELANKIIDVLAVTVAGVSLFAIGGMLVGLKTRGIVTDLSSIVVGKLIIHPLYIVVLMIFFPAMPLLFQHVAILLACMPMFSIFAVIGMRYQYGGLCSAVLLPTTLVSFITINLVVWLISS
ncbi:MAG: malonate transporter [Colwellia sp.]|jgi:malonate transporter|tara:strand:- start:22045 stop:22983 length:939 start_codon:yes stop_codon:yes gene_type:complete